jgi:nucleotide sugar dehydrogenase
MNKKNEISVCVLGVGYVGEHLVNTFSKYYNVIGVDLSKKRVEHLKTKYSEIHFQTDYSGIESCNVFLVSVPTLVKSDKQIDLSCLYSVRDNLKDVIKSGSLIMVESSVYVGATREIFGFFRERGVFVGFSPERVDPGRTEPPMELIPKVVSGLDYNSLNKCVDIYSKVIDTIVPVSSTECAEMCKLYENCFRMVNIAYVNEISDMCDKVGIDVKEMIDASSTKPFGFMPFYPGIGVGGHCIPVNPYYLMKNGSLPVLEYATNLMEKRPKKKAFELMDKYDSKNVLIVGIGFKTGESLLTNSPGYDLYKELVKHTNVDIYDPLVQNNLNTNIGIKFLDKENFRVTFIKNKYDLIVINLNINEEDKKVIDYYERMGGKVHIF